MLGTLFKAKVLKEVRVGGFKRYVPVVTRTVEVDREALDKLREKGHGEVVDFLEGKHGQRMPTN